MKTLEEFIKENREELLSIIGEDIVCQAYEEEQELMLWVMNDEGLYNWAKREGMDTEKCPWCKEHSWSDGDEYHVCDTDNKQD